MGEELHNIFKSRQAAQQIQELLSTINGIDILGFVSDERELADVRAKYNEMTKISANSLDRIPLKTSQQEIDRWIDRAIVQANIKSPIYLKVSELYCSKWIQIRSEVLALSLSSILSSLRSKELVIVDCDSKSVLAIFEEEDALEIHFRK
jgi:hypothetical protein